MIRRLGARYELEEPIGGGGMAVVYRAMDTLLNRTVAVKMLRPQFAGDDEFVSRFRQEAQSAARLSHPNIVNLYDIGVSDNEYYLVMEYVEGPTLKEIIKQSAPMEFEDVIDISMQICDALEHAHHRQIIHRDVKPHNILLTKSGQVKVTDFGIARAITGNTVTYQQSTSVLGSVHYFSPEQARGAAADVKSDVYSLGVVMYEMLTGELPFSGDTPVSVALKHLQETFAEPRALFPEIPQSLENIVLRCLVKSPDLRYPDMQSVKRDLGQALQNPDVPKFVMPKDDAFLDATIAVPAIAGGSVPTVRPTTEVAAQGDDAEVKPRQRVRIGRVLLGTLVALCVLILAAFAAYYIEFHWIVRHNTLNVPNVIGQTEAKAVSELKADNFLTHNIIVKRGYNNSYPAGHVYNQDPKSPQTVMQTQDIYVYVSRGPQKILMPDLQNFTLQQAEQELQNKGFSKNEIKTEYTYSDQIDQNMVVDTNPEAGSSVSLNDQVTIAVSRGPRITVPYVIGLTVTDAKTFILQEHLQVGTVSFETAQGYTDGTVISTSPPVGQQLAAGDKVNLVVVDNSATGPNGSSSTAGSGSNATGGSTPSGTGGTSGDNTSGGSGGSNSTDATGGSNSTSTSSTPGSGNSTAISNTGTPSGTVDGSTASGGTSPTAGSSNTAASTTGSGQTATDVPGGANVQNLSAGNTGSSWKTSGLTLVPVYVSVPDDKKQAMNIVIQVVDAQSKQATTYLSTSIQASESWTVPVYVSKTQGGKVSVYADGQLIDEYPVDPHP